MVETASDAVAAGAAVSVCEEVASSGGCEDCCCFSCTIIAVLKNKKKLMAFDFPETRQSI
jgi:hypothetical protein